MILIYSKDNCSFCDKAKALLKEHNYSYKEKNIVVPDHRQELLTRLPDVKTVPQIFIDSKHIGGYTELVKYLGEQQ